MAEEEKLITGFFSDEGDEECSRRWEKAYDEIRNISSDNFHNIMKNKYNHKPLNLKFGLDDEEITSLKTD